MKIDNRQIEEVYSKNAQRLFLVSLRILGDSQEAEDVMQDTILKVCADAGSTRPDNLEAYLTRSCVNRSLDVLRKKKTARLYLQDIKANRQDLLSEQEDSPEEREQKLRLHIIRLIATRLPSKCRQVVSLKLIEGFDYEEIEQILTMKSNTVRSNYMRGRQLLADILRKEGLYERIG